MTAVETEGGDKIITHRQNYSGSAVSRILVKNSPKAKNQTFIYISLLSLSVGHLTLKSNTLVLSFYLTIPRIRYLMYDTFSVINCGRYKNFGNSWVDCGHGGPKPRSPGIMLRKKQSSAETTIIFQIWLKKRTKIQIYLVFQSFGTRQTMAVLVSTQGTGP